MAMFNRKIDYALLILCYLHHKPEGGSAREIASHFNLSRPFVANILKDLCHTGYVTSQRGVKGGYVLRGASDEITLANVLEAMDDEFSLTECNSTEPKPCCSRVAKCPLRGPLTEVHARVRSILENVTLAELFGKGKLIATQPVGSSS